MDKAKAPGKTGGFFYWERLHGQLNCGMEIPAGLQVLQEANGNRGLREGWQRKSRLAQRPAPGNGKHPTQSRIGADSLARRGTPKKKQ